MQKSLSFSKGITASPSDLLADDTELTESVGLIFRDGEMHPIQNPVSVAHTTDKLIFVHRTPDSETLVAYDPDRQVIHLLGRTPSGDTTGDAAIPVNADVRSVNAVGNTLVIATDSGLRYLLLKAGHYVSLGSELPKPSVSFSTVYSGSTLSLLTKKTQAADLGEIVNSQNVHALYDTDGKYVAEFSVGLDGSTPMKRFWPKDQRTDDFQTAITGHVSLVQNLAKQKNLFLYPFFVRYALRLFDGSYARISAPVAVYPSVSRNGYVTPVSWKDRKFSEDPTADSTFAYLAATFSLQCKISVPDIDQWQDIVKEVVVFATDDVMPWTGDADYQFVIPADSDGFHHLNYVASRYPDLSGSGRGDIATTITFSPDSFPARYTVMPKAFKSEQEIIDQMLARTQFFKLFSVANTDIRQNAYIEAPIKTDVLTNLMQQEQLPVDDYYGWTSLVAEDMYAYNKRINLFRAKRLPFRGFCDFTAYGPKRPAGSECLFFVHIVSDTMNAWVKSDTAEHIPDVLNSWFFYPDPNATELVIWDTAASAGQRIPLKRHNMLNGAYSFSRLPLSDNFTPDSSLAVPVTDSSAYENLSSQIFTSVVNNPFVFQASGDNTVGTGSILALAANTEPISQGQFGQYPLIVFTTEGIYAMSVSDEGLYSASYPISREVCNNPASVTPTGRLVFFTSSKGLMAVSGGTVSCLSSQLDGRNPSRFLSVGDGSFLNFLSGALLAYDYRDSLLHILNPDCAYEYVYSIPYATFAKAMLASTPVASVSAYPDTLIQLRDGTVLSLAAKPSAADDTALYDATFTTRPLKLGSSLQLKTIHRIVHLLSSDTAHLALAVHASNDCRHWCPLTSLHGKPWKYYTLTYTLTSLHAADTFAGSVIDFQPLLPDKIR